LTSLIAIAEKLACISFFPSSSFLAFAYVLPKKNIWAATCSGSLLILSLCWAASFSNRSYLFIAVDGSP
jgi:hypothetical protein